MLNNTKLCIFLKTVIKLCYMNWHLVKLYAMKIKCKTFVILLSIFQNDYRYLSLFVKMAHIKNHSYSMHAAKWATKTHTRKNAVLTGKTEERGQ